MNNPLDVVRQFLIPRAYPDIMEAFDVFVEQNDKYKRTLEYLLYQSGHKDGNIGEAEMKLIEKALSLNTISE